MNLQVAPSREHVVDVSLDVGTAGIPRYVLVLADIDAIARMAFAQCHFNQRYFIGHLRPKARQLLREYGSDDFWR